jgi:uncharacterized Fe-S cluster-containing radical SAM superfamily protein
MKVKFVNRGFTLSYDPIQRHLAIEKLVTREGAHGQDKKYYRIRPARWYGGIVTADCVGCGLLCRFCWVSDSIFYKPSEVGKFYSPSQIAYNLYSLAVRCGYKQIRVSGGEPTIGKQHLLQLLSSLEKIRGLEYRFILETNGILIAHDEKYSDDLSNFHSLHVRVSLKGCSEEEFQFLTGAKSEGFQLQLKALENLVKSNVSCHPSVMSSFSSQQNLEALIDRLRCIDRGLAENMEIEELILYPHVMKRIRKYKLKFFTGYRPDKVPPERI